MYPYMVLFPPASSGTTVTLLLQGQLQPGLPASRPTAPVAPTALCYRNTLSSRMQPSTSCTSLEVGCPTRASWGPRSRAGHQAQYLVQENPPAPLHPTRR